MSGYFLMKANRPLTQRGIELRGPLNRIFRSLGSADNLDQRNQVRRIEWMPDDASLEMGRSPQPDLAHGQSRRAGRNDHVRWQQFVELPIELSLEVDPFRSILLDKLRVLQGPRQIGHKLQICLRGARREPQSLESWPSSFNITSQRCVCVRRHIRHNDLQALRQEERCPARADDAGSY